MISEILAITAVILVLAFPFLALLGTKLHQGYISRKISSEYHKSLNNKSEQQDEDELMELIWDLEVESEQYIHYHNTLQ